MKQLLTILLVFTLSGCKTTYIPAESVRTEYKDRLQVDSIIERDSIFLKIKGDTIWKERYITRYRDRIIRDSIFKTDSIPVPYEVIKEVKVEKKLSLWQRILIGLGNFLLCAGLGLLCTKLIRWKL